MITPKRKFLLFASAVLIFVIIFLRYIPRQCETLYINGVIATMDDALPMAEAMAVSGDRIVFVGTNAEAQSRYRPRTTVDLHGKTLLPGLIDSHAHLMSLGLARMTLDLLGTASEQQAVELVKTAVQRAAAGQWVRGRGWDQNDWKSKSFPTAAMLDKVSGEVPVILSRVDGHAIWVNSRAMELAGVTNGTKDPDGGKIIRDRLGKPSGVFVDNAEALITGAVPPPTEAEAREAVQRAMHECLSDGMTTVHDMGIDTFEINLYRRMAADKQFPMRVYGAIGGPGPAWEQLKKSGPVIGFSNDHLTIRAIKMYMDGALGSRGAALIEPYSDDPGNRGLTVTNEQEFRTVLNEALDAGFQVCTHAIGDRGNHIVLDLYEEAIKSRPIADRRLRVEHAQVLAPEDIPRFAALNIIPAMQPTHCTSDMYWAEARVGPERVRGAYAWRSLLATGAIIPGGSDFPVEDPNPLWGIYAAVTRKDKAGRPRNAADVGAQFELSAAGITDASHFENGWYPGQRMTREEALKSFTIWGARAGFEENLKGSLQKGKLADFIVLSNNIFRCEPEQILSTVVERTFVGGKEVYTRQ